MGVDRLITTAVLVVAVSLAGCAGIVPGDSGTDTTDVTTSSSVARTDTTSTATSTTPSTTATTTSPTATTTTSATTTKSTRTTTVVTTATRTPIYEIGRGCSDAWISLWGLPAADFWEPDAVQIGYHVGPNASMLLVVEANGSVVGVESVKTQGSGLRGQGYVLDLDRNLTGFRAIQASIYADRNENGRLDVEIDRPCAGPNGVVDSSNATVDFDRLSGPTG